MPNKHEKIVETRLALKRKFEHKIANTPAQSDVQALGTGPLNAHGMPRLPVGQSETKKWPVLDLGTHPAVDSANWRLSVDGACERPATLSFDELLELEQVEDVSDFHCVTTWSRMGLRFRGVQFREIAALCAPLPDAEHVMCHGYDGYTTNVSLVELMKCDVLLAHSVDGARLPREHGGPVRLVTPQLYAWKGAKWLSRIEFMTEQRLGFWEQRGYSSTAHPWRNDRYG